MLRSDHYCKIKRCTCIVFHRNWESSLILTNENRTTTSLIFSSSDASRRERHQRTSRQTRERDIGIYGEKENERVRGRGKEKERNRVRMCLHDCGEGPVGVSESIFGCGYSQCGYAVQILFGQAPEVWECGKAVLHNSLCRRFTRLDVARGHTRSGPVLSPLVAPYSRGRFSRSNQRCVSPSQFSVTLEERPSKGENCSIIIRFPFSLFSYLYIIPPLWHNTVHRSRKVGENRRVCITNAPNMSLLQ